jgi:hypothetical protein
VSDRPTAALSALALVLLAAGCDRAATGVDLWRAGRFSDSLAAFRDEADRAGGGASPELLYDRALAAARAGEPDEAESAAGAAAARGGPEFAELRGFLRGNAAYSRAETFEFQADLPAAPPDCLDRAIGEAQAARDAWTRAASDRRGWPAAERNARRAAILLDHLKAKKASGATNAAKVQGGRPRIAEAKPQDRADAPPLPEPPRPQRDSKPPIAAAPGAAEETPLTRADVLKLLDRLDAKEREKLDLRRARRAEQPADVERDW